MYFDVCLTVLTELNATHHMHLRNVMLVCINIIGKQHEEPPLLSLHLRGNL